ncbi:polycystic kidney disease and receptor for egg jelly-related protein-like [Sphaerodactylus townsendi]|uniref:polycystic kidney disease and receptor for egg jelly-related protein-like n=1 Tax=Sphaerodactylus townsendi TaxID=933632 RepID=UPI002026D0E2|nr:polycystic kidney disease and receptor for egg jelly-related protein-like [Sphaerodactylus townsendi]
MHCLTPLLLLLWYCSQYTEVLLTLPFLPPPLSVTCSNPRHRVYQRQDSKHHVSCLWDGDIQLKYSKAPRLIPDINGEENRQQPPPRCLWYRDAILVNTTNNWSGELVVGTGFVRQGPHPPWIFTRITMHCVSSFCYGPTCLHHNLSIEMTVQDVRLFLLWPHNLPIREWQPVQWGWCARLKSSTWIYHFRSQGGSPADQHIPANQHNRPTEFAVYPRAELHQVCESYYSYHTTVKYPLRGFYTVSLRIEKEPQLSRSLDLYVQPALLHVFTASSRLSSFPHKTLGLSWTFQPLTAGITAFVLVDEQGHGDWYHSYNALALQRNFCAAPKPQHSREKVVASTYFRTNKRISGELRGKLHFSGDTLISAAGYTMPTHLTLNPQKIRTGTYIFSKQGLFYSTQKGSVVHATSENTSSHYIFYQQESFSFLIILESVQLQWYRFNMHMYLNRRGSLFRSLGEQGIEVHVFSGHSPDINLAYIVWFIPVQHPRLQCEWSFNLQLFDSKNDHLLANKTYSYKDHVRNAAHFLPHSLLPFRAALYTGFVAEVNCGSAGMARAVLNTEVSTRGSKVLKPTVPCQKSYCQEVTAIIQKPDPSNSLISYTRQSTITLQATAKALCRTNLHIDIIWEISSVHSKGSSRATSRIRTVGVTFHLPGKLLKPGLYHLTMTVTAYLPAYNITIRESDSVTIHVVESDLVAVIAGGSFRTVGVSDPWTLDASASFDPDSANPHAGLVFNWLCSKRKPDFLKMKLSTDGKCRPGQETLKWTDSQEPVQIVQRETLLPQNTYYFILRITKGRRTADAYQTVRVLPGSLPVLNFTCVRNCRRNIIPAERLTLYGKCLNCEASPTVYQWSLLSSSSNKILFDWDAKTSTGRSIPYLSINPLVFNTMPHKSYTLSLTTSTKGRQDATYEYSFSINNPPRIGKCTIYPRVGTVFLTKFSVQCSGWEDEHGPLTYKIIAHSDDMKTSQMFFPQNSPLGTIVYVGHQRQSLPCFLPLGTPSKKYTLIVSVQVYDALGAFSQDILQATVHDSRRNQSTALVLSGLHNLISRSNAPMSIFFETKDYFNIGYYVYMVASVLNNIRSSPAIRGSKTYLRETLLNVSAGIPMTEIGVIRQVIASVCQITQEVTEINGKSQLLTVRKFQEATKALQRQKAKDLDSKETEILLHGIFRGLSNVLTAALLDSRHVNIDSVKETIAVAEILANLVLQDKVPGEYETNLEAKDWAIHLRKDEKRDISQTFRERKCKNCFYPKLKKENDTDFPADAVVSTVLYEFVENPFPWLVDAAANHMIVIGFKMTAAKENGDTLGIIPEVVEVMMDIKNKDSDTFGLTVGPDKKYHKTTGGFSFEVRRISTDIFVQIESKIKVTFNVSLYLGLNVSNPPLISYVAYFDKPSVLNGNYPNISDCAVKTPYVLCFPRSLLWSSAEGSRADKRNISIVLQSHPFVRVQTSKVVRITVFTTGCLDLDRVQNQWEEETCTLGSQTSQSKIHCICKLKDTTIRTKRPRSTGTSSTSVRFVAGTFQIYPNPLDITKVLLAEFDTNPVTLFTVFFIFAIYIFLIIWATMKDRLDMKRKDKILVLPDNDPFHRVCYVVTVYTGSRVGSGTTADVFIELIGQNAVSDVHRLQHPTFPILFRAAVNTFLITTKKDLGDIFSLHVWHNNGGSSPNWYLSRVKVLNVKTKQSWLFLCRNWFGLGKADCKIERSFLVTNQDLPLKKMDYFLIKLAKDLEDSHVWLSVFSQVVTGPFSRVQRISCCLVIMLTSLLFNIMFFSGEQEEQVISIQLRYLKSIYIGFVSAMFSLPVHLTIIILFRYSQEKPSEYENDENEQKRCFLLVSESSEDLNLNWNARSPSRPNLRNNYSGEKDTDTKAGRLICRVLNFLFIRPKFAWWCKYVSWTLVFLISIISSSFIILYGLTYGYTTSLEWFIASMTSLFQSVFLVQILKMVLFSAMSTVVLKYCKHIPWISTEKYEQMKLEKTTVLGKDMKKLHHELVQLRASREYRPLEEDEVIIMRKRTRAQHLAFVFVKDIICHLIFSSCVLSIAYSVDTTTSFRYNQAIYEKFSVNLSQVNRLEDVYTWTSNVFVPLIHNDDQPTYLLDTWSKILGLPRMRQIRASSARKTCFHSHSFVNSFLVNESHCRYKYGKDPEDETDYIGSWTIPMNKSTSKHSSSFQGFTFESDIDQWEYKSYGILNTYGPEGYSFYFFPREQRPNTTMRLDDLQRNVWLDERTWVVIFELTIFNADIDQYCSITVMFETSDIGIIHASLSTHTYKLSVFRLQTKSQIVAYGLMTYILIFYLADEFNMLRQERIGYLKTTTNLINFAIKTSCIFFILLIALKFKMAFTLIQFFLLNPEKFVPFHVVSQIDQLYRMVAGVLTFLLVLKPYRYFRFMYNVRLAEKTIAAALPLFVSLSVLTGLLLFAHISFGYLTFGEYQWDDNDSMIHSGETIVSYCFHMMTLKDITFSSNSWIGLLLRVLFIYAIIGVLIHLWQSVVIFTYASMKQPTYELHSDEAEAVNFVVHKIQSLWCRITHQTPSTSSTGPMDTIIFGKVARGKGKHLGLKSTEVEGQKMVYLSV